MLACLDLFAKPEEKSERIRDTASRGVDWNRFNRMAVQHRLASLVCLSIDAKPGVVPLQAFAALRLSHLSNAHNSNRCADDLLKLQDLLESAEVPAIFLKGPTLSVMAYSGIEARQYVDIDVLVPSSQVLTATTVLQSGGYRERTFERLAFESGFFRNSSDEFACESGTCLIDLRWKISDWYFPFGPDEDALWSRTETVNLKGREVRTLGGGDYLLFLCAHASKHGWPDLLSIADIGALLRARPALDLPALIDEAARLHFKRMVLIGLLLAHRLTHAPLSEDVLGTIGADSAVTALGQRIEARLLAQDEPPSGLERWKETLGTIERRHDRLGVLLKLWLAPTTTDYASLHLPNVLYPLYYLVRPFRLVMTALVTAVHCATSWITKSTYAMDETEASDALN